MSYFSDLPKKIISTSCLLFNDQNEFLIVKPSYRETWTFPGGVTEKNESPHTACLREVQEELSIGIELRDIIAISCVRMDKEDAEIVVFVFDGGTLSSETIAHIKPDGEEILEYRFISVSEASAYLSELACKNILLILKRKEDGRIAYIDNGKLCSFT